MSLYETTFYSKEDVSQIHPAMMMEHAYDTDKFIECFCDCDVWAYTCGHHYKGCCVKTLKQHGLFDKKIEQLITQEIIDSPVESIVEEARADFKKCKPYIISLELDVEMAEQDAKVDYTK